LYITIAGLDYLSLLIIYYYFLAPFICKSRSNIDAHGAYIYMLETFVIKRVPLRASRNTWWEFPLFKVSVNMCV